MRTPIVLAALLAFTAPAAAADDDLADNPPDREQLRDLGQSALDQMRRAFRMFEGQMDGLIDSLPEYRMPYRDEEGNIVIPRPRPKGDQDPDTETGVREI